MKALYLLSIVWFSLSFQISAQSQTIHLGFKLEFFAYNLHIQQESIYSKGVKVSPLPSMYIIISKDLSESLSISLKPGILVIPDKFGGVELGLAGNYKIYESKYFLLGGVNMHFVTGTGHGNVVYEATDSKTIYSPFLGFGYQITSGISIDIAFHQALNGKYGHMYYGPDANGPSKLLNMLKLGVATIL